MAFNILVVDDSAVMRAMVIKTLRLSGVPVLDGPVTMIGVVERNDLMYSTVQAASKKFRVERASN